MKELKEIREEIDRTDRKIFELLKERLSLVIATIDVRSDLEDLSREEEILKHIDEISEDENEKKYLKEVYSVLFRSGKEIKDNIKNEFYEG